MIEDGLLLLSTNLLIYFLLSLFDGGFQLVRLQVILIRFLIVLVISIVWMRFWNSNMINFYIEDFCNLFLIAGRSRTFSLFIVYVHAVEHVSQIYTELVDELSVLELRVHL